MPLTPSRRQGSSLQFSPFPGLPETADTIEDLELFPHAWGSASLGVVFGTGF
jgi:hypothetical protein